MASTKNNNNPALRRSAPRGNKKIVLPPCLRVLLEKAKRFAIYKLGSRCALELQILQKTTHLLIPKRAMGRLIKEIANTLRPWLRLGAQAYEALHHAAEAYLVELLQDSYLLTFQAKRVTLRNNDLSLLRRIRVFRNIWFFIKFRRYT